MKSRFRNTISRFADFPSTDKRAFPLLLLDAALIVSGLLIYVQPSWANSNHSATTEVLLHERQESRSAHDLEIREPSLENGAIAGLEELLAVDCITYSQYLSREDCPTGETELILPEDPLRFNFDRPRAACDRPNHLDASILGVCLPLE
jgi:hypothetical protein